MLRGQNPEFVVFNQLVQGKFRMYMKGKLHFPYLAQQCDDGLLMMLLSGITVIQAEWLPRLVPSLCIFERPLETPAPYYDAKVCDSANAIMVYTLNTMMLQRDDVRCTSTSVFGRHMWPLPAQDMSYPDGPDRYRYFARFFLEGLVCSSPCVVWRPREVLTLNSPTSDISNDEEVRAFP